MDALTVAFVVLGIATAAVLVLHIVLHRRRLAAYSRALRDEFSGGRGASGSAGEVSR